MKNLAADLESRQVQHLYRTRRVLDSPQGPEICVDGRILVNFSANDYLGLAGDAQLVTALVQAAQKYGVGAGAAHLISGHSREHHLLEEALAEFTGRSRALLFSSGYQANLAVAQALLGRSDHLFQDKLNHASLVDAAVLARAKLHRYRHLDLPQLSAQLKDACGEKLVSTDAVFSMDGDLADLPSLSQLCSRQDAWLQVDDAHGFGVLGATGGGSVEHVGLDQNAVPILMATLGKALGTAGAFVAGSEDLIETLIQNARTYIFTTAQPPALAAAARVALKIVQQEAWRREKLMHLIERFRQGALQLGLGLLPSLTPIQPLLAGQSSLALAWSNQLEQAGFWVPAVRPPTVPQGAARLRVTLSAKHSEEQIDRLIEALAALPKAVMS